MNLCDIVLITLFILGITLLIDSSIIYSDGTDVRNSMIEIHGLEKSDPKYIICIGVGTWLSVKNYRKLAEQIIEVLPNSLTVILDPNPSGRGIFRRIMRPGIIKFRANDFASEFCKASSWIHVSTNRRKRFEWYVGGHSSSGQGAFIAVVRKYLKEKISGFIGLDPCCIFNLATHESLLVPSLIWTTSDPFRNCVPSAIAGAGFHKRIISLDFGKVHISRSLFKLTDKSKHCVFADDGCPIFGCTGDGNNVAEAHLKVARSIRDFVTGRLFHSEDYPQVHITTTAR